MRLKWGKGFHWGALSNNLANTNTTTATTATITIMMTHVVIIGLFLTLVKKPGNQRAFTARSMIVWFSYFSY